MSTEQAHTPEQAPTPWYRFLSLDTHKYRCAQRDNNGGFYCSCDTIVDHNGELIASEVNEDAAKRICAAVNACADIPAEALEAGVVAEMLEALRRVARELRETVSHELSGTAWIVLPDHAEGAIADPPEQGKIWEGMPGSHPLLTNIIQPVLNKAEGRE